MKHVLFITLKPKQNGLHFADNIFKYFFFKENFDILFKFH